MDISVGITMNGPADVNQRPKCDDLGLPCATPRTMPDFGIALQASLNANAHVGVVGEASRYANHWDTVGVNTPLVGRSNAVTAWLIGPRLSTGFRHLVAGKDDEGYRGFTEVLAGGEWCAILPARFALQPGAGVDVKLSANGMWFRTSFDYRWTNGAGRNLSGVRVLFAMALAP